VNSSIARASSSPAPRFWFGKVGVKVGRAIQVSLVTIGTTTGN
jgi:hypothetical protein